MGGHENRYFAKIQSREDNFSALGGLRTIFKRIRVMYGKVASSLAVFTIAGIRSTTAKLYAQQTTDNVR